MLPGAVAEPVEGFVRKLEREVDGKLEAVYIVGSPALADFSARQSNIDLVVVTGSPLGPGQEQSMPKLERGLERARRLPSVWYTTWEVIADGPVDPTAARAPAAAAGADPLAGADGAPAAGADSGAAAQTGASSGARSPIDTPLTRALLRSDGVAVTGPDWPVVAYDERVFREWCRRQLDVMAERANGMMLFRRGVAPLVLDAARLAEGATSGRVLSKSEAGESAIHLVPQHFRRILHDSVGYRQGAHTSMYWGPFERKYDARQLILHLVEAAHA